MLQLASSRRLLQSLLCHRPNTKYIVSTDNYRNAAGRHQRCCSTEQHSSRPCQCSDMAVCRGKPRRPGMKKEQVPAAKGCWEGLFRGLWGEAEMISLLSLSPLVPPGAAGHLPCACCTRGRRGAPQRTHFAPKRGGCPCPCPQPPVTPVGTGGRQQRRAGRGRGTRFLVWVRLCLWVTLHPGARSVTEGNRRPSAGEDLHKGA